VAVGDQVADNLIERLIPRVQTLKVGPGIDLESEMGPLVTKDHFDKVMGYIDKGVQEGADLVLDGRDLKLQGYENGYFMGGSIFDRVTTGMSIYTDEIFGPVLAVVRAPDYGAAVTMVNDHEYGNGAAIFTRHMHGMEGVRFYTKLKTITSRWPTGIRAGAEFVMPTLG
jgi:malonate-semialdehyde dehydrogenase (acetylating)/methylmalonate-semialdehyde dehydrogenase